MQVKVSKKLMAAFAEQRKNPNYALAFILDSMDPNVCVEGIKMVDVFSIDGETDCIRMR